jgi:hypothetical protein
MQASTAAAPTTSAFNALAMRAAPLVPGMREVARVESGAEMVDLVRADARDLCVRVAYEATATVTARLVDRSGGVLAASHGPTLDGLLGENGPVCIRRGDVVRGVAEAAPTARVRWMAWEAP